MSKLYGSVIEMLCDLLHGEVNRTNALEAEVASLRINQHAQPATVRNCGTCWTLTCPTDRDCAECGVLRGFPNWKPIVAAQQQASAQ